MTTGSPTQGSEAPSDVIALAISPDGRYLLAGQTQGELQLFNMPNTAEIRRFEADVPLMTSDLSPDGHYLLTGALHRRYRHLMGYPNRRGGASF